jgi:glycosyltransferase involved in cell wall biosynthesis
MAVVFVSIIYASPWGGSEELWSRTALHLATQGYSVCASVRDWSPRHPRVQMMMELGVDVWFRPAPAPLSKHIQRTLSAPNQALKHLWCRVTERRKSVVTIEAERLFARKRPQLVVISQGDAFPPIDLLDLCIRKRLPFVTIQQANFENWWLEDNQADRYRAALAAAQRCYFVSQANRRLTEKQIGCELTNGEVIRNPVNIDFNVPLNWPELGPKGEFRFACVARLDPRAKGQDILFEALATPLWAERPWRLYLYGEGPMRDGLERLARALRLADRLVFAGYASVENIWARNHVLILPSRFEGLPLTVIEAMLCGRPVVATDVAGNSEVIDDGINGFLAHAPTVGSMRKALERFWERRHEAQKMGEAASMKMRELYRTDPIRVFSEKIKEILSCNRAS